MSAFLAYGGAYEFAGRQYRWRCYATARVHAIRKREHVLDPKAADGLIWVSGQGRRGDPDVLCLMDEGAENFSQMLIQIEAQMPPPPRRISLAALPAH